MRSQYICSCFVYIGRQWMTLFVYGEGQIRTNCKSTRLSVIHVALNLFLLNFNLFCERFSAGQTLFSFKIIHNTANVLRFRCTKIFCDPSTSTRAQSNWKKGERKTNKTLEHDKHILTKQSYVHSSTNEPKVDVLDFCVRLYLCVRSF